MGVYWQFHGLLNPRVHVKRSTGHQANINTLRWPEIHVTKGMVDERLIEILKSSNVPEPIDTPFDMMINKLSSNSSKLPLSELLKVQHHGLWLSVQKHLDPPSYPSPESTARVWSSWCEDNCMNYCQTLWSTYKQSSFDNLHDWLSAQRAEANYDGCGVSFEPEGMSIDGGAEDDNMEDNLSFLEGLHDPETLLQDFTHPQDLEPTCMPDPAESQSDWSNER